METLEWNFLIFQQMETYISGSNFPSSKNEKEALLKCLLYFGKWNFLGLILKTFLYFRMKLTKP